MFAVQKVLNRHPSVSFDLFLVSAAANTVSLALPLAMLQIYDRIIPNQNFGTAWLLIVWVLISIVLEALLRSSKAMITAALCERWEVRHHADSLASIPQEIPVPAITSKPDYAVPEMKYAAASDPTTHTLPDSPASEYLKFVPPTEGGFSTPTPVPEPQAFIPEELILSVLDGKDAWSNNPDNLLYESFTHNENDPTHDQPDTHDMSIWQHT